MVMTRRVAYQHVPDFVGELDERLECRGLGRELEQQPDELERECGLSRGLRLFPHTSHMRTVEPQGYAILPWAKSNTQPLFGRKSEDQGSKGHR